MCKQEHYGNRSWLLERVMIATYKMGWREGIPKRHLFKTLKREIVKQSHGNHNGKEEKDLRGGVEVGLTVLGDHLDVGGKGKDHLKMNLRL